MREGIFCESVSLLTTGPPVTGFAHSQAEEVQKRRVLEVVADDEDNDCLGGLDFMSLEDDLKAAEDLIKLEFWGGAASLEALRPGDWPKGSVAATQKFREQMWTVGDELCKGATGAEHAQFLDELSSLIRSEILGEAAVCSRLALNRAAPEFRGIWRQVDEAARQVMQLKFPTTQSTRLGLQLSWMALLQFEFLGYDACTREAKRRAWLKKQAIARKAWGKDPKPAKTSRRKKQQKKEGGSRSDHSSESPSATLAPSHAGQS